MMGKQTKSILTMVLAFSLFAVSCGGTADTTTTVAPSTTVAPATTVGPATTETTTPTEPDIVTVRVSLPPFGSQAFIVDMIETQGLGEKHGITIERHEFSGPPAHYLQITGDVSDIAAATWLELQQNQARGLRVVGVGPNLRYINPMVVGVNSGIESIEDLKGKRIAVYFQAGTDVLAARAAIQQKYGFDFFTENDVTSADAPLLSTQLERGDVDAILTFSNFAAALVAEGKGRILFVVADLLNEVFGVSMDAPFGVYITSANVANNYPERIERFLAAYLDAVDILVTDDSVWPALAESRGITDPAALTEFMESERQGFATEWNDSVFDGFEEMFNTLLAIGGQDVVGLPEFDRTTYTTDFWSGG